MKRLALLLLPFAALVAQKPPAAPAKPAPTTAQAPGTAAPVAPKVSVSPLPSQGAPIDAPTGPVLQSPPPIAQNSQGETVLSPRIRNITKLHNTMPHQLVGVGIVTGLSKGSSDRGTRQAIINIIRQNGLNLSIADVIGGSTTLVTLTASLPPFAKQGQAIDVKCEVITDSLSLLGGELLRAELKGVDGQTYVVAQGPVNVSGYAVAGTNAQQTKNTSTTGWVSNGGLCVREEPCSFYSESGALEMQLLNPSAFNAASVAAGIKATLDGTQAIVTAVDTTLVRIELPEDERTEENALRIINLVGNTRVTVENPAKVMIDQSSGMILAGEGVLISPCVVGISDLTITVSNDDEISQPNAFATGETQRVTRSRIQVQNTNSPLTKLGGPSGGDGSVSDLLGNLKSLGLTPGQLVTVFQALDQGGFLHGTLEVR